MVRIQNTSRVSVTLHAVRDKAKRSERVLLKPGEHEVEDEVGEALAKLAPVKRLVAEGTLRFPGDKTLEKIYAKRADAERKRLERLSAIREDRKVIAADREELDSQTSEALVAVQAENQTLREQMAALTERLDKAEAEKAGAA